MRLIFLIAAPRDAAGPYIQTVAKVARLLRSPSYEGQLLAAESAEEIAQLIDKFDRQHPRETSRWRGQRMEG